MPSRRALPLIAVAALLAVAALYLGVVAEAGGEAPGRTGAAAPESSGGPAAADPAAAMVAEASAAVTVELHERGRILPAWEPPPVVVRAPSGVEIDAEVAWVAGTASVPGPGERAEGWQLLRIDLPGGRTWRIVHVSADATEVVVEVGGPVPFRGVVVDGVGEPIAGARVWVAGRETRSDEAGELLVHDVRAGEGVPVVLRAEGKADRWEAVVAAPGAEPERFELEEAAPAKRMYGSSQPPREGPARVLVRPAPGAAADVAALHYPFFLPAIVDEPWPRPEAGELVLRGLPRGGSLQVVHVVGFGGLVATELPRTELGRTGSPAFSSGHTGPPRTGRVLDPAGRALAGAILVAGPHPDTLRPSRTAGLPILPAAYLARVQDGTVRAFARAGTDGSFEISPYVHALEAWAPGHHGVALRLDPRQRRQALDLILPPAGSVVGPPVLELEADRPTRVVVARGGSRDPSFLVGPGAPRNVLLEHPAVLDVVVRGPDGEHCIDGIVVPGPVRLPLP